MNFSLMGFIHKNILRTIKHGVYVIHFDEYDHAEIHWVFYYVKIMMQHILIALVFRILQKS